MDWINAHNSALVAVPCTSGPTAELSMGEAGWQFFKPGVVGPVIVGEGEGVGDGVALVFCTTSVGGDDACEPLEHAGSSASKKAR